MLDFNEKDYLKIVTAKEAKDVTKGEKGELLEKLEKDIKQAYDDDKGELTNLHALFTKFKEVKETRLRVRRHLEKYVPGMDSFGDTASYKEAVGKFLEKVKHEYTINKTFKTYVRLNEIYEEAHRLGLTKPYEKACTLIETIKRCHVVGAKESWVYSAFNQDLIKCSTTAEVLDLYKIIYEPNNILRYFIGGYQSIFATYGSNESRLSIGNTTSYKKAILAIAQKLVDIDNGLSGEKLVTRLLGELKNNKPYFRSKEWTEAIDKLSVLQNRFQMSGVGERGAVENSPRK